MPPPIFYKSSRRTIAARAQDGAMYQQPRSAEHAGIVHVGAGANCASSERSDCNLRKTEQQLLSFWRLLNTDVDLVARSVQITQPYWDR
jgi:hypothetical protein